MRGGSLVGLLVASAVLAFAQVGFAREAPASDAEKQAATKNLIDCRISKSRQIDNGVTDPTIVGQSVAAACGTEMQHVAAVFARGESEQAREILLELLSIRAVKDATSIVMLERIGPAEVAEDPTSEGTEMEEAIQAYDDCLTANAENLDDGISDALTIGTAIASACKAETVRMALVLAGSTSRSAIQDSAESFLDGAPQEAASVVLRQRSGFARTPDRRPETGSSYDPLTSREAAARGQLMTGAHLKAACEATDEEWNKCSAFIRGVMFAYRAGILREGGKAPYCPPERYFAFEWTGDVRDFLNEHPNFADLPAQSAVLFALEAKYPCSD